MIRLVLVALVLAGCAAKRPPVVTAVSIEDGYTAAEVDAKMDSLWEYVLDMKEMFESSLAYERQRIDRLNTKRERDTLEWPE